MDSTGAEDSMHRLMFCSATLSALALLAAPTSHGQELPPEIQVDRLLVQAERETASGEHWSAAITLERVLEVYNGQGLEIPAEFWFRQAGVLQEAGLHEQAVEAATRYLREAGREGVHYQAALRVLDSAEEDLAEARRAEARARAAAERAEREAAERTAAIAASVPDMVAIPGGSFRMGCVTRGNCENDERPVHEVRVAAFELSKYEVTFAQWDVCTEYGDCRWVGDEGWGRGERPVINVSWHDAQQYLSWLSAETGVSYRLPSEAEWEYAARAGAETRYSWGNDLGRARANCDGCGSEWDGEMTAPVGSFPPNGFGLHDMHGNVSEWLQDCWNNSYRGAPSNGSAWTRGDCSRRIIRGGSWGWEPRVLRLSYRGVWYSDRAVNVTGFRIARTLAP